MNKIHKVLWTICQRASRYCMSQAALRGVRYSTELKLDETIPYKDVAAVSSGYGANYCLLSEQTLYWLAEESAPFIYNKLE